MITLCDLTIYKGWGYQSIQYREECDQNTCPKPWWEPVSLRARQSVVGQRGAGQGIFATSKIACWTLTRWRPLVHPSVSVSSCEGMRRLQTYPAPMLSQQPNWPLRACLAADLHSCYLMSHCSHQSVAYQSRKESQKLSQRFLDERGRLSSPCCEVCKVMLSKHPLHNTYHSILEGF